VDQIRDAPDVVFPGYPVNPKAGYRISGRIFDFYNYIARKMSNKLINKL
jgi:hypothetical protein